MEESRNYYLELKTYPDIYRELVHHRNEAIHWIENHALLTRNRRVTKKDRAEWQKHQAAKAYRLTFRDNIIQILERLYYHDAVEATYDFNSIDLLDWSDTEANRFERELQRLQSIITKLETRYGLQYKVIFEYRAKKCTLYLNNIEVLKCQQNSIRHRVLSTVFSKANSLWNYDDVGEYFIENFGYNWDSFRETSVVKAGNDINKDVAAKTAVNGLLSVGNSSIRVNPDYIA